MFITYFIDCHFDRRVFSHLGGEIKFHTKQYVLEERQELTWSNLTMSHLDPRTLQCEKRYG